MISIDVELALVGVTAMLEPATLLASTLALVVTDRPLHVGTWFYVGGLAVTLLIGALAAFVLGNAAASHTSEPKTWVAIVTLLAGLGLLGYGLWLLLRPVDRDQTARIAARINKLSSAPALAIIAAGAVLANPGVFMLIAAKSISQLNPTTTQYLLDWALFAFVALIPLGTALLMLLVAPGFTKRLLVPVRAWVERHAQTIAAVVVLGLAASLLRDGVAGLTG